ncbi:MAG: hypothetical protein M5U31_09560 [Acidimicrobiia bacterium]|nr:hypothetical protein [Acidimicrobiia bacterium]
MSDTDPIAPNDTGTDDGSIVAPRRIRGRHLVGITAIVAVVVVVAAYFIGFATTSADTRSEREEQVLQAAVMGQAVEFGDFLLDEQAKLEKEREDDEDATKEEKELAKQIGYDDLLEDSAEAFADESDLNVDVHEIKDDDPALPKGEGEEPGKEIDDNGLVQVQIGFTDACLDLNELVKSGPASDLDDGAPVTWVTGGECEI